MTVYVDQGRIPFRRMLMAHMVADTIEELHAMADRIGLDRRWFQGHKSTPHYDVCQSYRARAIAAGAKEIDKRELVTLIRIWRERDARLAGAAASG